MIWHITNDLVYNFGSRISETIEKKAGVLAYAKTNDEHAEMAAENPLSATIL